MRVIIRIEIDHMKQYLLLLLAVLSLYERHIHSRNGIFVLGARSIADAIRSRFENAYDSGLESAAFWSKLPRAGLAPAGPIGKNAKLGDLL
jgi:hypothetical protein